jgi:hypothetical protein
MQRLGGKPREVLAEAKSRGSGSGGNRAGRVSRHGRCDGEGRRSWGEASARMVACWLSRRGLLTYAAKARGPKTVFMLRDDG